MVKKGVHVKVHLTVLTNIQHSDHVYLFYLNQMYFFNYIFEADYLADYF